MQLYNTIDLYRIIRKENIKTIDILKNISLNLSLASSGTYMVYNILSNNEHSLIYSNIITTMLLIILKHTIETNDGIKKEVASIQELNDVLRQSDQYKKLDELYKNYITKLALLIKSEFNPTTKECIYIYDSLLKDGYLSLTNKFEHKEPKLTIQTIPELSGAKIFCGTAVCLDESEFLVSLLNELNVKAITIPVLTKSKKSPHFIVDSGLNTPNHAITGVMTDDKAYIYCQTSHLMLNSIDGKYTYKGSLPLSNTYYYCIKSFLENLNYGNSENIKEFFTKKQVSDNNAISEIFWCMDSDVKVLALKDKFLEFNNTHKEDMEQMSNLIKVLSPYKY